MCICTPTKRTPWCGNCRNAFRALHLQKMFELDVGAVPNEADEDFSRAAPIVSLVPRAPLTHFTIEDGGDFFPACDLVPGKTIVFALRFADGLVWDGICGWRTRRLWPVPSIDRPGETRWTDIRPTERV